MAFILKNRRWLKWLVFLNPFFGWAIAIDITKEIFGRGTGLAKFFYSI